MQSFNLLFSESFLNGKLQHFSEKKFPIINPVNQQVITTVFDESRTTLSKAIDFAYNSFQEWKNRTAKERASIVHKWYELLIQHKEELAHIISLESGKPIKESLGEVDYAAAYIEWFSEEAKRNYGDIIPPYTQNKHTIAIKQPIGVVGIITPWNFPIAMITRKVAPALAVGCTVVIRPSELTPLSALAITSLAYKAGIPDGVIHTIIGSDASEMGKEFCENPKVAKISFTGSTRVGKILMQQSSHQLKKLSLELGGNAPFIIFDDADIELAVKGCIAAKFRFSGQTCVCVNRIFVHENIFEKFTEQFLQEVQKLKMGDSLDSTTNIAPIISKNSLLRLENIVQDAVQKGAKILCGGKSIAPQFFEPTVLTNASDDMLLAQEEIFGPIAALYSFKTEKEVIQRANNTPYGLASYFYTKDLNKIFRISESLEYGMIGINEGLISSEMIPFGGVKESGIGREGSKYGLDSYTEIKYICLGNLLK